MFNNNNIPRLVKLAFLIITITLSRSVCAQVTTAQTINPQGFASTMIAVGGTVTVSSKNAVYFA